MALLWIWLAFADTTETTKLRYLKPQDGAYVLESEVTTRKVKDGTVYTSKTVRGRLSLTLTIQRDDKGNARTAAIVQDDGKTKTSVQLERIATGFRLTRDGQHEDAAAPADAVLTSAPDWSDIFELVRRYDLAKKGKQEFAGLWFHPKQKTLTPTFALQWKGSDKVKVKDKEIELNRFEIRLRDSTNRVWALPDGTVVKIAAIVLEGYEAETRHLK